MILCGAGDLEKPFLMQVEGVYFAIISPYFYHMVCQTSFPSLVVVPSPLVVLSVASLPKGLKLRSSALVHTSKLHLRVLVRMNQLFPGSSADQDQRCSIRNWTEYVFNQFLIALCLIFVRARPATTWVPSSAASNVNK